MAFAPNCVRPEVFRLTAVTNVLRTASPYSFKQTAYDFMGGMWRASLDLYAMKQADRATFLAWLVSLDGPMTPFEMRALDYAGPSGTVSSDTTVHLSAPVRAKSLSMNVPLGTSLAVGDRITIDGHLHVITDAPTSISGVQTVSIWPRLRSNSAPGSIVQVSDPFGTWVLANSENTISLANGLSQAVTLDLMEAL